MIALRIGIGILLTFLRPCAGVGWSTDPLFSGSVVVSDYIAPCPKEHSDFTVALKFKVAGKYSPACVRSYERCPFDDGSCLGGDDDWTAESGRTFEYLETHTFYVSNDATPKALEVNDDKGTHACARALYKDQYKDFPLGAKSKLSLSGWWESSHHPLHLTIIPFNASNGQCSSPSGVDFDAERALAVWLSPYEGQSSDPGDGSVYCDLSKNPDDCLNMPFWGIDGNDLVLYGPLNDVLSTSPSASGVSIYLPEGWDINLPINNNEVHFSISSGSLNGCRKFLNDGVSPCYVDSGWMSSFQTDAKITVSGLGRINGWAAMKWQKENNVRMNKGDPGDIFSMPSGSSFSDWQPVGEFYISAFLLSLASSSTSSADGMAIDVSGVEVAWGSKLGVSGLSLNSLFSTDVDDSSYSVKTYDVKTAGMWNDQADGGGDIMGSGSDTSYSFIHSNDDALKVAAPNNYREHATILQGNAGSSVMLGAYGLADIDRSTINGVYIHRIVHSSTGYQGCGGAGGMVSTRSCAMNSNGLVDTTVVNLYVPQLGDINSVSQAFGIGVDWKSQWCSDPPNDPYPISNLVFEYFNVYPEPSCESAFYDSTGGNVQWGDSSTKQNTPSVAFYDAGSSDPAVCNFQGAVSFNQDPQYFVCGLTDDNDALDYCMTTGGVGSKPNVDYQMNANPNILFPTCGYPGEQSVAIA